MKVASVVTPKRTDDELLVAFSGRRWRHHMRLHRASTPSKCPSIDNMSVFQKIKSDTSIISANDDAIKVWITAAAAVHMFWMNFFNDNSFSPHYLCVFEWDLIFCERCATPDISESLCYARIEFYYNSSTPFRMSCNTLQSRRSNGARKTGKLEELLLSNNSNYFHFLL